MSRFYSDYVVRWDPSQNKFNIRPVRPNASHTIRFGLGNAVIMLNTDNPFQEITTAITGETTAGKMLPTNPYKLKGDWFASLENVQDDTIQLTTRYGSKQLSFKRCSTAYVKERSDTTLYVENVGYRDIENKRVG